MYSRQVDDEILTFGVSGLLYRSNVLMYDHQSESLWSQILRESVAGPKTGTRLKVLPSTLTRWQKWRQRHPETEVLTMRTGYLRDYSKDPYEDYYQSSRGLFGFLSAGPGEEDKELVVGIEHQGRTMAFSYDLVKAQGKIQQGAAEAALQLSYDADRDELVVKDGEGRDVSFVMTYWFVWKAFHPETQLRK